MKQFPVLASRKEMIFGWRYLFFEILFLPSLLGILLGFLPFSMTAAQQNFLFFSVNFLATVLAFRQFLAASLQRMMQNLWQVLLIAAAGFAVYLLLSGAVSYLLYLLEPDFFNVNDRVIGAMAKESRVLMGIGTVLLVPPAEEILCRGVVFGTFRPRRPWLGYLISIVLFSLIHINGYIGMVDFRLLCLCFLQYVPAGICLAAAYDLSGTIAAPILIHAAVNAMGIFSVR